MKQKQLQHKENTTQPYQEKETQENIQKIQVKTIITPNST